MKQLACAAALALAGVGPALAELDKWTVGVEREHAAGSYSTYWGDIDGWHLWSIELQSGRVCRANKGAPDARVAVPFHKDIFDMPGTNLTMIYGGKPERVVSSFAVDGYPRHTDDFRAKGERFFTPYDRQTTDWADMDGQELELRVSASSDPIFEVSLVGAKRAKAWVESCVAAPALP